MANDPMFEPLAVHLREKHRLAPDWHAWAVEAVGEGSPDDVIVLVTGAECPHRITRGPRKGAVNFKRTEGLERTFPITLRKYRELIDAARS